MPAQKVGRLWKFKNDKVDTWVKTGGANYPHNDDETENYLN